MGLRTCQRSDVLVLSCGGSDRGHGGAQRDPRAGRAWGQKRSAGVGGRRCGVAKPGKNSRLGLLSVHTRWGSDYPSFRRFNYALASAAPLVIIDDVSLAQTALDKPLAVIIELSTYYRLGANGS